MKTKILYISYDGLTDPLGQSQILAYLKRLSEFDNQIVIYSYEKKATYAKFKNIVREVIDKHNLIWEPVFYTKSPPVISTLYDIQKGIIKCKKLNNKYQFDIVHCRGYIPSMIGRKLKQLYNLKFIFDMRGWWVDEKSESGLWNNFIYKSIYKYFKKQEVAFFKDSDYIVSLTLKGKETIVNNKLADEKKIGVIPTCVDFDIFEPFDCNQQKLMRQELGIRAEEKVFVYSGSLGGNYDPLILIKVFKIFEKLYKDSYLLILSKDDFSEELQQLFITNGINRVSMLSIPFLQVTDYLRTADAGFIYYKMSFSAIGRSPTKLGEYWASGLPVISFSGIGDLDTIIAAYPDSGILLQEQKNHWLEGMKNLEFPPKDQLREYARDYFHIDKGIAFYKEVYSSLSKNP